MKPGARFKDRAHANGPAYSYSKGFLLSLCIHGLLLCLLFFSIETTVRREALPQKSGEIVQASLLDENKVQEEVERLQTQEKQKKQTERNLEIKKQEMVKMKQEADERLAEIKLAKEKEQKKLEELRLEKEKEEKKLKALAERKKEEEDKLKELAKKKTEKDDSQKTDNLKKMDDVKKKDDLKKKAEQPKKATDKKSADKEKSNKNGSKNKTENKSEKKELVKNAVDSEEESLLPKSEWMTSEIEKYDALMKQKINQNWVRPLGLEQGLTCQLFARLLPDGSVISPEIKISSGNLAFDQAAIAALQNASPLPMPSDPNLIDEFRQFNFKFTPPEEK